MTSDEMIMGPLENWGGQLARPYYVHKEKEIMEEDSGQSLDLSFFFFFLFLTVKGVRISYSYRDCEKNVWYAKGNEAFLIN